MEARIIRLGMASVFLWALAASASAQLFRPQPREYVAHSQNFIVFAASQEWATQVSKVAEQHRHDLAIHWLGEELPNWSQRCPIHVHSGPQLGAQGETRYTLLPGGAAGQWMMSVTGTPERILDSVLPHEITHTIFASHFAPLNKYVPRWADEGACTTVEHDQEKGKHRQHLVTFLQTGRGLAFNTMFRLKEYPDDILPLYAQGHSAVQFLIDQGGPQKFVQFLEAGMQSEKWSGELNEFYGYQSIGEFQTLWNKWLADGSPDNIVSYAPSLQTGGSLASMTLPSQSGSDNSRVAIGDTSSAPVALATNRREIAANGQAEEVDLPGDPLSLPSSSQADTAGLSRSTAVGEGWYKRQLREMSGSPATPIPAHNTFSQNASPSKPTDRLSSSTYPGMPPGSSQLRPQSAARPMPSQSTGIQVLDWGAHAPVQGMQSPVYR